MPVSEILKTASTIAARFEARGETITAEDAIARAIAARQQLAQLEAMRELEWADTALMPAAAMTAA